MVSVIIINYKTTELLRNCLRSLLEHHKNNNFEIIVVDNNSEDESIETLEKEFSGIKLIKLRENVGFSRANNIAAKEASMKYLLFINSDIIFIENSIDKMLKFFEKNHAGIVGPKLINLDRTFQLSAGKLPNIFVEMKDKILYTLSRKSPYINSLIEKYWSKQIKEVEWVTGACMLIEKTTFEDVNGFDENIFLYFEDKDICARVRRSNKKIYYYPETSIIHLLGGSSVNKQKDDIKKIYRQSQKYYYKKHLNKFHNFMLKVYLFFNVN